MRKHLFLAFKCPCTHKGMLLHACVHTNYIFQIFSSNSSSPHEQDSVWFHDANLLQIHWQRHFYTAVEQRDPSNKRKQRTLWCFHSPCASSVWNPLPRMLTDFQSLTITLPCCLTVSWPEAELQGSSCLFTDLSMAVTFSWLSSFNSSFTALQSNDTHLCLFPMLWIDS